MISDKNYTPMVFHQKDLKMILYLNNQTTSRSVKYYVISLSHLQQSEEYQVATNTQQHLSLCQNYSVHPRKVESVHLGIYKHIVGMTKKYVIILQNNKSRKLYLKDLTAMSYKVRLQIPLQPPYEDKKEEQDEPSPVEPGFTFEPFSCTLPPIKIE